MKKTLLFFALCVLSVKIFAQVQNYNFTVCGYIQTLDINNSYNNNVTMSLMINGFVVSNQTAAMNGSTQVCFQSVNILDSLGLGLNYTASLTIDSCPPIAQSGYVQQSGMINIPLSLCTTSCNAYITTMPLGAPLNMIQANCTGTPPFTYIWNQGANTQNVQLTTPGIYNVYVTDANGCVSSASFNYNGTTQNCGVTISSIPTSNTSYLLTANAVGQAPFSYAWNAGNPNVVDVTPNLPVTTPGVYCVNIIDANGCVSSTCDTIITNCSTTLDVDTIPGTTIQTITAISNGVGGTPLSYVWTLNGTPANTVASTITMNVFGIYCCTITAGNVCVSQNCYNYSAQTSCTANIIATPDSSGGIILTALSNSGASSILTYSWSAAPPLSFSATSQSINVTTAGTYSVIVTDINGCVAQQYYTYNLAGNCSTLISDSVVWSAHILNTFSTGTPPFTYHWQINGTNLPDTTSSIFAPISGIYLVSVTDAAGCVSIDTLYVNIPLCNANTSFVIGVPGGVTTIIAGSTGVAPYTFNWTYNGQPFSTQQSISLGLNGTYCYIATDANGCVASDCFTDTTSAQGNCSAFFTSVIDSLFLPISNTYLIDFTAYPNGNPLFTYSWTFSDGTTSNVQNPQHNFSSTSNSWAWASLTITDGSGCVSTYSNSILLPAISGNCNTFFSASSTYSSTAVGAVQFSNLSTPLSNLATFSWSFGDGTSSTMPSPIHTYTASGTYYVCLTVTNPTGCVSQFCQLQYINLAWWTTSNPLANSCSAGFIILPDTSAIGITYLVDISQVNNPFYTWNTSIGFISNSPTPFFNLTNVGTYDLCLTVTDTVNGCTDTFCDSLTLDSLGGVTRSNVLLSGVAGIAILASPRNSAFDGIAENTIANTTFSVQPNPANDMVTIKLSNGKLENTNIGIVDIAGNLVREIKIVQQSVTSINTSDFSNGTYFIKVISNTNNSTQKLIINH